MNLDDVQTNFPILLLYNIDSAWPEEDIREVNSLAEQTAAELEHLGHPVRLLAISDACLEDALAPFAPQEYIVFNWCEEIPGLPGSEALVASLLEKRGFTFTGSSSQALAASKDRLKSLLVARKIPTPPWTVYDSLPIDGWQRFPAIVKPAREHCSSGIDSGAVVVSKTRLAERVEQVLHTFQQPALVEEFICGRELTVTLIGNETLRLLPVAEIDFSGVTNDLERIRTCESKFAKNSPAYQNIKIILPADLSAQEHQQLQKVARAAYRAAACRDYVRLDLRLRDGVFYVLDINHNADLSPDSSLSLAAQAAGLSHGQLISLLVNLAAKRHPTYRYFASGYL
jgi:D-alanine-D-alanine ligase